MTADEDIAPDDALPPPPPVPWYGPWVLGAFVSLVVASNVGSILLSRLLDGSPALLLALTSRNRHLVLTVPSDLGPLAWAAIATARLAASATVCHLLGRAYGDRALRWFWRFLGMPQEQVAKFERQVSNAEWIVVPWFVGSNIVWALTGAAATTWKRLLPMFVVGMAARLAAIWWLTKQFESQVTSVITFLTDYQYWIIGGSLLVVVLVNVRNFRGGR